MKNKTETVVYLFLILFGVMIPELLLAGPIKPALRFPVLYNPNPVAGRLYLQPIGVNEARVIEGTVIDAGFGSSADYNVRFIENDGDDELTVNSNIYSLSLSHGADISGYTVEIGGIVRAHQDFEETWGSNFVKNYHEAFPSDGFGHVPPDGQFSGAVGNNGTRVIGDNRELYLTTAQLYMKYQLMTDSGPEGRLPDLSLKLSSRIPLSSKPFDRPGVALSTGVAKEVYRQFQVTGAGALVYQDLSKEDFNADNIDVENIAMDLYAGIIWDMGKPEGWYGNAGVRWASERVSYTANSKSSDPAFVTHFGFSYRKKMSSGNNLDFYISFSEDIPGLGYGLEPDVAFFSGLTYHIK